MWKTGKMLSVVCLYEKKLGGKQDWATEWLVDEKESTGGMRRIVHRLHRDSTG